MSRQRPLALLLLVAYIFAPTLFGWALALDGAWYRPYLIWLFVIIAAYLIQGRKGSNDI